LLKISIKRSNLALLLQEVASGRLGGFFLQREMHALMAAILLGMARLDPYDANLEPEPPHCQLAQVKQGVCRSEGHAVVTADVDRQAALLKKPFKHSKSVVFAGGRKSLTGEEKAASVIGDGPRIAVLMIPQQELALVIGAPQFIGLLAEGQSSSLSSATHATAALDQAIAIEHRMDGAFCRNLDAGESADQALPDFPGTPAGMLALHVQDIVCYWLYKRNIFLKL
jgi:hypothetical protein